MKLIDEKKLKLLNAFIDDMSLELKISKANELIKNPFYVFDMSLTLLFSSNYKKFNNNFLAKIGDCYFIKPSLFTQILTDDDLKYLDNGEVLLKKYKNIPRRFMVKRIDDGKYTVGYAVIYLKDESIIKENRELLEVGVKALAHEFKQSGLSNNVEQVVFSRIIDGSLFDKKEMELALNKIKFNLEGLKRLAVVKTENNQEVCYLLNNMKNNYTYFVYDGDVLLFVEQEREKVNALFNEILSAVKKSKLAIGISGLFKNMDELPYVYKDALEAIEIGERYISQERIHYFGDYRFISLLREVDKKKLVRSIDRRLKNLIKYDSENNTTYLDDLKAYFNAGRNIIKQQNYYLYIKIPFIIA